jgi:hypothetical protein
MIKDENPTTANLKIFKRSSLLNIVSMAANIHFLVEEIKQKWELTTLCVVRYAFL